MKVGLCCKAYQSRTAYMCGFQKSCVTEVELFKLLLRSVLLQCPHLEGRHQMSYCNLVYPNTAWCRTVEGPMGIHKE